MYRNLDMAALRSFISVADTGGVTRAAKRLHLTQSAVSMQLRRLEEMLGLQLLQKSGRSVILTAQGEELLSHARRLINLNDEIWGQMTAPKHKGEITLGVPHDMLYPHIPDVMRRFDRDFPGVKINLIASLSMAMLEQFRSGEIDVLLTTESGCGQGGETLDHLALTWVGAPGGTVWEKRPLPLAFERRCAFLRPTLLALEKAGIEWQWMVETESFDAALTSIAADLSVCTMLQGAQPPYLENIDTGSGLPELPAFNVNLYIGDGPKRDIAEEMGRYMRDAFSQTP